MLFRSSEAEALALLEGSPFDALLVDFNLGDPDASELLNQAAEKCPNTTRFLFANEADLALVAAKVQGDHEILPKPLELATIRSRIESALADLTEEVGTATGFDTAATIPPIYNELLQALESPGVTSNRIGNIIARDDTLVEETLKLTRSAYLGLPHRVTEPVDAVEVLGLETVRTLVLALRFMAEHSHVRPGYLSLEKIWQHSTGVARIARDLVLFETKDRALASQALAAGLVHDFGKVVLATNFDDLYGRVHSLARKQPVALWEIEKEMFGASHGEIGACLLGMWNLPAAVVDATAFHHEPPLVESSTLTPLAAVHIANVLAHQLHPTNEFRVLPVASAPFLNELGLLRRLPIWQAAFANERARHDSPETAPVAAAVVDAGSGTHTGSLLPAPTAATQTASAPANSSPSRHRAFAAVLAGVLFVVALSFAVLREATEPWHAQARELPQPELAFLPPTPPEPEPTQLAAVPEITAPPVEPMLDKLMEDEEILPEPELPATTVVATPVATTLPTPVKPAFRLNGVFYSANKPSAVVNGEFVSIGDEVNGAAVVSISRESVVLEINGQRTTIRVQGADGAF